MYATILLYPVRIHSYHTSHLYLVQRVSRESGASGGISMPHKCILVFMYVVAGRPGGSEVPRNPLTRWDVSSIPANGIFLTKKLKNKNKNAQRVEND